MWVGTLCRMAQHTANYLSHLTFIKLKATYRLMPGVGYSNKKGPVMWMGRGVGDVVSFVIQPWCCVGVCDT